MPLSVLLVVNGEDRVAQSVKRLSRNGTVSTVVLKRVQGTLTLCQEVSVVPETVSGVSTHVQGRGTR